MMSPYVFLHVNLTKALPELSYSKSTSRPKPLPHTMEGMISKLYLDADFLIDSWMINCLKLCSNNDSVINRLTGIVPDNHQKKGQDDTFLRRILSHSAALQRLDEPLVNNWLNKVEEELEEYPTIYLLMYSIFGTTPEANINLRSKFLHFLTSLVFVVPEVRQSLLSIALKPSEKRRHVGHSNSTESHLELFGPKTANEAVAVPVNILAKSALNPNWLSSISDVSWLPYSDSLYFKIQLCTANLFFACLCCFDRTSQEAIATMPVLVSSDDDLVENFTLLKLVVSSYSHIYDLAKQEKQQTDSNNVSWGLVWVSIQQAIVGMCFDCEHATEQILEYGDDFIKTIAEILSSDISETSNHKILPSHLNCISGWLNLFIARILCESKETDVVAFLENQIQKINLSHLWHEVECSQTFQNFGQRMRQAGYKTTKENSLLIVRRCGYMIPSSQDSDNNYILSWVIQLLKSTHKQLSSKNLLQYMKDSSNVNLTTEADNQPNKSGLKQKTSIQNMSNKESTMLEKILESYAELDGKRADSGAFFWIQRCKSMERLLSQKQSEMNLLHSQICRLETKLSVERTRRLQERRKFYDEIEGLIVVNEQLNSTLQKYSKYQLDGRLLKETGNSRSIRIKPPSDETHSQSQYLTLNPSELATPTSQQNELDILDPVLFPHPCPITTEPPPPVPIQKESEPLQRPNASINLPPSTTVPYHDTLTPVKEDFELQGFSVNFSRDEEFTPVENLTVDAPQETLDQAKHTEALMLEITEYIKPPPLDSREHIKPPTLDITEQIKPPPIDIHVKPPLLDSLQPSLDTSEDTKLPLITEPSHIQFNQTLPPKRTWASWGRR
eukprot:GHVP01024913.1.p1 GENE.GHVP01024913.1~~GHVP01024913.1.p1  ORF type:complete len:842 (+),score=157.31 GHVP01024913.1:1235-3760(+)